MQYKTKTLVLLPLILALGACADSEGGEDDDNGNSGNNSVTGLVVSTVSGDIMSLTGTWKTSCYSTGGADSQETLIFSASTVSYSQSDFSSTDSSCSGTKTVASSYTANVSVAATASAITGWTNGEGSIATGPMAANNSGALSNTEAFTNLSYTLTAVDMVAGPPVGSTMNFVYVVDDTGTGAILYRGDYNDNTTMTGATAGTVDPFILQ